MAQVHALWAAEDLVRAAHVMQNEHRHRVKMRIPDQQGSFQERNRQHPNALEKDHLLRDVQVREGQALAVGRNDPIELPDHPLEVAQDRSRERMIEGVGLPARRMPNTIRIAMVIGRFAAGIPGVLMLVHSKEAPQDRQKVTIGTGHPGR